MKKIYLLLLVGFIIQCSSDSDTPAKKSCTVTKVPAEEGYYAVTYGSNGKVSKLQYFDENDQLLAGDYQEFFYNDAGKLSRIDWYWDDVKEGYYEFVYDGNKITQTDYNIYGEAADKSYSRVYTVDTNGKIIKLEYYDYEDTHEGYEEYEYNSKGNVVKLTAESFVDEEFLGVRVYTLEYDNNPNPFNLIGIYTEEDDFFGLHSLSVNNIIRAKKDGSTAYQASYNYNSHGYPVSSSTDLGFKVEYDCE